MKKLNPKQLQDLTVALPQSGDVRKQQIFRAVIEIIGISGIDEVTFESVGKKAKMARSHVAYYFPTRRSMIFETLEFVALVAQHHIQPKMLLSEDWIVLLWEYVDAHFHWLKIEPYHHICMAYLAYQASIDAEFRDFHSKIRDIGLKRILSILSLVGGVSKLPINERKLLAHQIQSSLSGVLQISTSTSIFSRAAARRACLKTCYEVLLVYIDDLEAKRFLAALEY